MLSLIQRVREAHVDVDEQTVGRIGAGLLALVAVQPADGEAQVGRLLERLVELAKSRHGAVEIGRFGAHMMVHLVNDGPVTFWLEAR